MEEAAVSVTELVTVFQSKTDPLAPMASTIFFLLFMHYKTAACQQSKPCCFFLLSCRYSCLRQRNYLKEKDRSVYDQISIRAVVAYLASASRDSTSIPRSLTPRANGAVFRRQEEPLTVDSAFWVFRCEQRISVWKEALVVLFPSRPI